MNKGRIEQVDAPYELYSRPKTRFVAGFIGRTNFLEGKRTGADIDFGCFSVPAAALHPEPTAVAVHVSIRPQSIVLHRQRPPAGGEPYCVPGTIQRRAYLGESWDYHISLPGISQTLRVTTRPQDVFEVNDPVFAGIDPDHLTLIN
jgi:iron(III) transport system ATP-binding protein